MAKAAKHGLGRGLGALLGSGSDENIEAPQDQTMNVPDQESVITVKISQIDPNRDQPRRRFSEDALRELADSIISVGIIQPILLRRNGSRYQIIAGERRWRAARLAGLGEIPAIVRDWDETKRLEVALIENLQRDDLNPIEQAMGIRGLMDQCGYTQEMASERLGMSRPALANFLRLLTLPKSVQELLVSGQLSAGHGRALVSIESPESQEKLADHAAKQGLSVRQLERLVKELPAQEISPPKPFVATRDPAHTELERMARDAFGTKAQLLGDGKKGKLVLQYYSAEDLQRIWDVLEALER